jgi:DNA-binding winged helix-turn-helix (wHTH) protein
MAADRQFAFGAFRFDVRTGQLWRDGSEVKLTLRAAAVLQMLVERAPEVVTKQELFDGVWGGTAVGDDSLTSCVHELRDALGDDARSPHTIETRHRRGYRFMMPATRVVVDQWCADAPPQVSAPEPSRLVGRVSDLQELGRAFDRAWSGQRQIVFVTGEPGIGKSSLADFFLEQLQTTHAVRIAHGQCLDHHGVGEPYLPLIEALTRLAGGRDGTAIREIISAQAPSWLAQMPSLWARSERSALEARGRVTRERMMRELTLAVETVASEAPILIKLEDIHWSDASTLDWLSHIARRPEPARLMVLATFRPNDAAAAKADLGGLVTELALHGQCKEIALSPLGLEAIEVYLKARLGDEDSSARSREMAGLMVERTGGNPLFMVSIVNELAQPEISGRTADAILSIPHDVRRFIDRQIDQLNASDRSLLTTASVIGREFATAAVAAALEIDIDKVETSCAHLSRQGVFIVRSASVTWPDGTPAELYSFRHDLYRELLYDRLPATRRALSHARVGRRLEVAWTGRLDVIASQLAEHFERGNELVRAIPYHQRAAAKALRRSANEEAIGHLRRALDAVGHIADEVERTRVEVELRVGLGAAFMANQGFGAPEVWTLIPGPRNSANIWASVQIFSQHYGVNGYFDGDEVKWTPPGGCARRCWLWQRNTTIPGSNFKPTMLRGRPRLAVANWRKSAPTRRRDLRSTTRTFIKPWPRVSAIMTLAPVLDISVHCRLRLRARRNAHARWLIPRSPPRGVSVIHFRCRCRSISRRRQRKYWTTWPSLHDTPKRAGSWRRSMTLQCREHGVRGSWDGALLKAEIMRVVSRF